MKQIITKATIVALILGLSSCATNTRDENTMIGAGTGAVAGGLLGSLATGAGSGWVIAAGVVVGALIGGMIGNNMESSDSMAMNTAFEKNAMNEPSNWTNDKTGVWYKIIPTSDFFRWRGNPNCRHYVAYGKYQGQTTKTHGIACRMDNGMWQQVR